MVASEILGLFPSADQLQLFDRLESIEARLSTLSQVNSLSDMSLALGSITAGTVTGGTVRTAATGARVELGTTGLKWYDATTQRGQILNDGSGWIGSAGSVSWATTGIVSTDGADLEATSVTDAKIASLAIGKLTAGSLTVAGTLGTGAAWRTAATGARIQITDTEISGYNASNAMQFRIRATDGKGEFGGGDATIDATGLHFSDTVFGDGIFWDASTYGAKILGQTGTTQARLQFSAQGAGRHLTLQMYGAASAGVIATFTVSDSQGGEMFTVEDTQAPGALSTNVWIGNKGGAGTYRVSRVTLGAADSGGLGTRLLRVDN